MREKTIMSLFDLSSITELYGGLIFAVGNKLIILMAIKKLSLLKLTFTVKGYLSYVYQYICTGTVRGS